MDILDIVNQHVEENKDNEHGAVVILKNALHRAGKEKWIVFFEKDGTIVLIDTEKDISNGIVIENDKVVSCKNVISESVCVGSMARYKILQCIEDQQDKELVRNLFKGKKTWVIKCLTSQDAFSAYTRGFSCFGHPECRIAKNIGTNEIAYLFNSIGNTIASGRAIQDGDVIKNLYENYDILATKSEDGYLDLSFVKEVSED